MRKGVLQNWAGGVRFGAHSWSSHPIGEGSWPPSRAGGGRGADLRGSPYGTRGRGDKEGMRALSWIPGTRLHRGGCIESQLRFLVESVVGAASISGACGIAAKKSGVFRFGGEVGVDGPQGVRQNAEENDVLLVEAVECGYGSRGAREGGKVLFI